MVRKYTVFRSMLIYFIISAIAILISTILLRELGMAIIAIGIFIVLGVITFNDYKIIFYDDKLVSYKLFMMPKIFTEKEILKIYVGKIDIPNRIIGTVRTMVIYMSEGEYRINVHELENKEFYQDLFGFTQKNSILYQNDWLDIKLK